MGKLRPVSIAASQDHSAGEDRAETEPNSISASPSQKDKVQFTIVQTLKPIDYLSFISKIIEALLVFLFLIEFIGVTKLY